MNIPAGAHPAPDDPMDREEVMRRAEAFDPTPAEQFVAWAQGVGECVVIQDCPCNGCAMVARELRSARIMRLALQMIVAQCGSYEHGFGESIDRIQRTAEQALREGRFNSEAKRSVICGN